MSAAAFAKGLLSLGGQLTQILVYSIFLHDCDCFRMLRCMTEFIPFLKVSLVSKDSCMWDGLLYVEVQVLRWTKQRFVILQARLNEIIKDG
ncbi:hypothetical protein ACFX1Q_002165 [Malus domestica]